MLDQVWPLAAPQIQVIALRVSSWIWHRPRR